MYRKGNNATPDQIALLLSEFHVREEDGQMLHRDKPCGKGQIPKVWLYHGDKRTQHSLGAVAWLLAFGNYPEHHVSFVDGTRDCRPSNLTRTKRKPLC